MMGVQRLDKQIKFIIEIDKMKSVYRQTLLMNGERNENDAEHSWHLAIMAILLSEYAAEVDVDILRVLEMVVIHDIVEIDAGDTFCYDEESALDKADREKEGADRIFGMLPSEQASQFRALWEEFEKMSTGEARFAAALDRLQPLLHNYYTRGAVWRKHGVTVDKVLTGNKHIADGAPLLWEYAERLIRNAVENNYLPT